MQASAEIVDEALNCFLALFGLFKSQYDSMAHIGSFKEQYAPIWLFLSDL